MNSNVNLLKTHEWGVKNQEHCEAAPLAIRIPHAPRRACTWLHQANNWYINTLDIKVTQLIARSFSPPSAGETLWKKKCPSVSIWPFCHQKNFHGGFLEQSVPTPNGGTQHAALFLGQGPLGKKIHRVHQPARFQQGCALSVIGFTRKKSSFASTYNEAPQYLEQTNIQHKRNYSDKYSMI